MKCKFCGRQVEMLYDVKHLVQIVDPLPIPYVILSSRRGRDELFDAEEGRVIRCDVVDGKRTKPDGRGFRLHFRTCTRGGAKDV